MATLAPLIQRMTLDNSPYLHGLGEAIDHLSGFGYASAVAAASTLNLRYVLDLVVERLAAVSVAAGAATVSTANFGGILYSLSSSLGLLGGMSSKAAWAVRLFGLEGTFAGSVIVGFAGALGRLTTMLTIAAAALKVHAYLQKNYNINAKIGEYATWALGTEAGKTAVRLLKLVAAVYASHIALTALAVGAGLAAKAVRGVASVAYSMARGLLSITASAVTAASRIGFLAGTVGALAVVFAVSGGLKYADSLGDVAARVGATTQQLAGLRQAAMLNASSAETLDASLTKMQVNLGKAVTMGGGAAEAFTRLGLSAQSLSQMNAGDAFATIADRISKLPTTAQQAAAAVAIFGRSGAELVPLLSQGAAGLEAFAQEAQGLGVSLTALEVSQVQEARDQLDRVGVAIQGVGTQLAVALSPYIIAAGNAIVDFATKFDLARRAGQGSITAIVEGARLIGNAWDFANLTLFNFQQGLRVIGVVGLMAIRPILPTIDYYIKQLTDARNVTMAFARVIGDALTPYINVAAKMLGWLGGKLQWFLGLLGMGGSGGGGAEPPAVAGLTASADEAMLSLAKAGQEAEKMRASFNAGTGDQWANSIAGVGDSAWAASEGVKALGASTASLGESADQLDAIERIMDGINEKFATLGMTASQIEIFKLQQAGASAESIRLARSMLAQIDAAKELKETHDGLFNAGQQAFESTRTPLEKHMLRVDQLNRMLQAGAVDADTYTRAILANAQEYSESQKAMGDRNTAGVRANSQEAFRAARLQRDGNPQQKQAAELQKRAAEYARMQLTYLAQIAGRQTVEMVPSGI